MLVCCSSFNCLSRIFALSSLSQTPAVSYSPRTTCRRQRQLVCKTIFVGQSPFCDRITPVRLLQSQPSLPICTSRTTRFLESDVSSEAKSISSCFVILYLALPL